MSRFILIFACLFLTANAFAEDTSIDDFRDIGEEVVDAGVQKDVSNEAASKLVEQESNAITCREVALKKSANSLPISDDEIPAGSGDVNANMTTPLISTQNNDSVTYLTYGAIAKSSFTVQMTLKTADCSFISSHITPN